MTGRTEVRATALARRFGAFLVERFPFASAAALDALHAVAAGSSLEGEQAIERVRPLFRAELRRRLDTTLPLDVDETTPGVPAEQRLRMAQEEILDACDGFFRRAAIRASL